MALKPLNSSNLEQLALNGLTCLLQFYVGSSLSLLAGPSRLNMAFSCPHPNLLRGIVQGSGLDHMLYIIMEGDLKALSDSNLLFKYADDTNHLVPEISDVDINDELNNVLKWAADNRMIVNIHKTQEIVFHRPSARYSLPSLVTGIEQVVTYLQSCPELLFLTILNLMSLLRIFSQSAINVVICLSV